MDQKTILVLGIGNLLLGDEGVGVHAAHQLLETSLPPEVEVIDGGTVGFELLPYLQGKEKVIIIDALHTEAEAGEVFRFDAGELRMRRDAPFSPHQCGLRELLGASATLVPPPRVVVIGVVPEEINFLTIGLSRKVHRQMPTILSAILEEIKPPVAKEA